MDSNQKNKFRPQQFNPRFKLHHPFKVGRYNWLMRINWSLKNYLHHVFSVLHYKSNHAPNDVSKKWSKASKRFQNAHYKIL